MPESGKDTVVEVRRIGTINVAVLKKEEAIRLACDAVTSKRPYLICFANAHTINTARNSGDFARALQHALVLNDGIGVDLASKLLYKRPFPDNLNGTDFTPELLNYLPNGTRVFLIGSPPGVAERAAQAIVSQHSHIKIVGTQNGFFADEDETSLLTRINASAADLLLVAMGHPRQEIWAARNVDTLGVTVMCVGALLDFYAGTAQRAPSWMRQLRVEWAYRLLREPRRLARRYIIGNATFIAHIRATKRHEGSSRTDRP
jgi:exopolysaccharide biosynthesis WecB/TagA/CpsF family protein